MCTRLAIEPVSPNDLRRTTAQWLVDAGVEPFLVAAVLGHKDTRMVERVYGKLRPETLKKALLARLGNVRALPAKADFTRTSPERDRAKKRGGSRG